MNSILINKWNKSLVIFISFLLKIKFIYLNKEVVYDKDLINNEIITL